METNYHIPVLLQQSIDGLNIKPNGVYVDATFGGGGHSREILKRLDGGRLLGFDQDEDAEKNAIDDKRFTFVRSNFKYIKNFIRYYEIEKVDGILADLGVSSHQFDVADRGFSFRFDAPMDMRMNQNGKTSAQQIVNTYGFAQMAEMFRILGEVPNAGKLAHAIITARQEKKIETINQFVESIKICTPQHGENKYLAQVFQALRMEVNKEIASLQNFLLQTIGLLKTGGRLSVITYHSLEDRLVKNLFKNGKLEGEVEKDLFGRFEVPFDIINKKIITPDENEIAANNRARSAKLRIGERTNYLN